MIEGFGLCGNRLQECIRVSNRMRKLIKSLDEKVLLHLSS